MLANNITEIITVFKTNINALTNFFIFSLKSLITAISFVKAAEEKYTQIVIKSVDEANELYPNIKKMFIVKQFYNIGDVVKMHFVLCHEIGVRETLHICFIHGI